MRKQFWMKLKEKCGETMLEALVACLIASIAISMLAMVMSSAAKTVQKVREIRTTNEAIMTAFWGGSGTGTMISEPSFSSAQGSFKIPVQLYAYEVTANGKSGTVYEFEPIETTEPTPTEP